MRPDQVRTVDDALSLVRWLGLDDRTVAILLPSVSAVLLVDDCPVPPVEILDMLTAQGRMVRAEFADQLDDGDAPAAFLVLPTPVGDLMGVEL
ncbi:MAG: hypothetical protein RL134_2519 [Actinomycetota bacterium]